MSQLAAGKGHSLARNGHADHAGHSHGGTVRIDPDAVTLNSAGPWGIGLMFVGVLGIIVTVIGGFTDLRHALAAYHVGALFALGLGLGSLMLTMIMHQFNAGWIATARRQLENVAATLPIAILLILPSLATVFFKGSSLWSWTTAGAHDELLEHKHVYLNLGAFFARAGIYFALWIFLSNRMYRWSRDQDTSGDRWLTARARRLSAPGIILLALATAFAGFDWIMGLDYHWFSTMFGVYFFAGNLLSAIALLTLILLALRRAGKLQGLVTEEHFHDLGKLLLAFTVFWAYITFSQYFLIWYSNIPEETGWFLVRRHNGWMRVGFVLSVFHFLVPFLLLLWKFTKRRSTTIGIIAAWLLVMHFVDLTYMVHPSIQPKMGPTTMWWLDLAGWIGPACLFLGFVVQRITAGPLIPLKDPRLPEAIAHKNYV